MNINNDSAFYYFNKIATSSADSLQIATAYSYMATIQNYEGDYYGGQESLLTSLSFLDERKEKDRYCLMADYHELGNNNLRLKNYDAAIDYFDKALNYIKDTIYRVIALNSKAVVYQKKEAYGKAIAIYQSILPLSKKNRREYARILSNYAKVKWLHNTAYDPVPEMREALQIRQHENDQRGLNASYAHLSDYYSNIRPDSALRYAEMMYKTARQIENPDNEMEALSKLITLGPNQFLKHYFTRYEYLNDSLQTARKAAKNQFALIRYEAEKNKSANLLLQKDNAQKKLQLREQQFIFGTTVLLFIIAGIVAIFRYRKRKQQIELKSRQTIQEHQLKTSQKVHDVVANGLYRIMTGIEHREDIKKDLLLDEIEILYEQSRDISYDRPAVNVPNFHDKITELLTSFATNTTKILITGNKNTLWVNTSVQMQMEVKQILQELMINMKKHSKAHNVLIKFERRDTVIQIHYADDGIGLPANRQYGNGLTNTENRIKMLGGQLTFDKTATRGLKILISFPTV
ncbi:MAG TPA: ATP-binding protein [Chitinophagaceae bacterium]|nr:ATP-binding protein [Chitinophagaceae bacterium]